MTKHLRLTIDFHISIADTPPLLPQGTLEPPDPGYDGRQARLLAAVKGHPETLTRWMRDLVARTLYMHPYHYWDDTIMGGELPMSDILAPAVDTLSVEDQAYFAEGRRCDMFDEFCDMFAQAFRVTEETPVIEEVL